MKPEAPEAVKFKDERARNRVTLQSSEVKEISEREYKAGLVAKPAAIKPGAAGKSDRTGAFVIGSGSSKVTRRSESEAPV